MRIIFGRDEDPFRPDIDVLAEHAPDLDELFAGVENDEDLITGVNNARDEVINAAARQRKFFWTEHETQEWLDEAETAYGKSLIDAVYALKNASELDGESKNQAISRIAEFLCWEKVRIDEGQFEQLISTWYGKSMNRYHELGFKRNAINLAIAAGAIGITALKSGLLIKSAMIRQGIRRAPKLVNSGSKRHARKYGRQLHNTNDDMWQYASIVNELAFSDLSDEGIASAVDTVTHHIDTLLARDKRIALLGIFSTAASVPTGIALQKVVDHYDLVGKAGEVLNSLYQF